MKPSTLDPEEGQPLLADSPTTRRATPKVLAAIAALCLTAAVAGSAAQRSYSGLSSTPLCDASVETTVVEDFKISDSTDYGCSAEGSYWAEMQSYLLPEFKNELYAAVNAPIQNALNTEFSDLLSDYDLSTCGNYTS